MCGSRFARTHDTHVVSRVPAVLLKAKAPPTLVGSSFTVAQFTRVSARSERLPHVSMCSESVSAVALTADSWDTCEGLSEQSRPARFSFCPVCVESRVGTVAVCECVKIRGRTP